MGLQRTPMYASLTRPRLLAGCERLPLFSIVLTAIALPFIFSSYGVNVKLYLLTVPVAIVGVATLRRLNSGRDGDPLWSRIYWRSLKFKPLYPAKAHPLADRASKWSAFK